MGSVGPMCRPHRFSRCRNVSETPDNLRKPAPQFPPFKWNPQREEAALLLAKDELTDLQIAERLEIGQRTLVTWKLRPEFRQRIDDIQTEIRDRIRRHGIAVVENRVAALGDRLRRMQQVIVERGASPEMENVPGGRTGLLVRDFKGTGEDKESVYYVDTALLREMREHEKQAAQELGQWTEKSETNGGLTLYTKTLKGVSLDEL